MIANFFRPNSIAVIGASENPKKIGFSIVKNLLDGHFPGKIYPVNLRAESIIGLKCYPNIGAIGKKVDMAIIAVPADFVSLVLEDCGKNGVGYAIIISAGFAEIGAEGAKDQARLVSIAKSYNLRVLGPNCLGAISPVNKLNASFAASLPEKKDIAVISQSGATCTAILDWANKNGVGFSHFVSLGNKCDLDEKDFLEYFTADPNTKVVLGYLESIEDGQKFIEIAKKLTAKKPFVLLKAGKNRTGQKAARSHTAALTADDEVLSEALAEAGVIRAETLEDLFEWSVSFSDLSPKKVESELLVITNAGGPAVMAMDELGEKKKMKLYQFTREEESTLSKKLPARVNVTNPIDLAGDATSADFRLVLDTIAKKKILKLAILTPQSNTDIDNIAAEIVANYDNLTMVCLIGGGKFEKAHQILNRKHIPVFLYPERAVSALEQVTGYHRHLSRKKTGETVKVFKKVAERALAEKEFGEAELARFLSAYRIPVADSKLAKTEEEVVEAAKEIGYPVVLKISSKEILHKTEAGVVKVGIESEEAVRVAYKEILKNARKYFPKAGIDGVTVYKMIRSSVEVAIGAKRDPNFGPYVMFGLGGVYIEVFHDTTIRLAPVTVHEAKEMIKSIKSYRLLSGYRNEEKYNLDKLAEAITGLSQMMVDFPEINEVDINPIRFLSDGKSILGLDAKIIFEEGENC